MHPQKSALVLSKFSNLEIGVPPGDLTRKNNFNLKKKKKKIRKGMKKKIPGILILFLAPV